MRVSRYLDWLVTVLEVVLAEGQGAGGRDT